MTAAQLDFALLFAWTLFSVLFVLAIAELGPAVQGWRRNRRIARKMTRALQAMNRAREQR